MPGGHHPRRAVEHRPEVVPVPQFGLTGRQPHPHRQLQRPLRRDRSINRRPRRRERRHHTVAGMAEQKPVVRVNRAAQHLIVCGTSATRIASASASHRRVDPSISVNKNVTTPKGAAAVMASPRPTPCAPRNQVMSPWRGNDHHSPRRQLRRRGHGPAARASAAAGFRSGQIRVGRHGGQPFNCRRRFLYVGVRSPA